MSLSKIESIDFMTAIKGKNWAAKHWPKSHVVFDESSEQKVAVYSESVGFCITQSIIRLFHWGLLLLAAAWYNGLNKKCFT